MTSPFLDAMLRAFPHAGSANESLAVREGRQSAFDLFLKEGLPGAHSEAWKYTPLRNLEKDSFSFAGRPSFASGSETETKKILGELQGLLGPWLSPAHTHLVFLNGFLLEPTSLPPGFVLAPNPREIPHGEVREDSFDFLNRSFSEPVFFRLAKNVLLEKPLHLIHLSGEWKHGSAETEGPGMSFPRHVFQMEEGSRAQVLESYFFVNAGLSPTGTRHFSDGHSTYLLGAGCALDFHQMQGWVNPKKGSGETSSDHPTPPEPQHQILTHPTFRLGRDSRLTAFFATAGAALERTDVRVHLGSENSEAKLSGTYLLEGKRHSDFHLDIRHAAPRSQSDQVFKGILNDESHAVFTGKVFVDKTAVGANSSQLSQTLLLHPKAHVDARPQLEILNNDVKCSHGATVGRLSEAELFYLRSRGLTAEEAGRLLCLGFIRELMEGVSDPSIRKVIAELFRHDTSLGRDL